MIHTSDYVPLILFLVIFFMAFSFLQTIILYVIKNYVHKHWKWVVDKLLSNIVHHKILVRTFAVTSLALVLALAVQFTPIVSVLVEGEGVVRLLGGVLAAEMIAVFFALDRTLKIIIEKRIHLYVYVLFSVIAFTIVMVIAEESYTAYEASVRQALVEPIVESIEGGYEQRVEDSLMAIMREKAKAGECPYYDYAESETRGGITQFIFIKEDSTLKQDGIFRERTQGEPLEGQRCVHETVLLLTPQGKWYQVLEQGMIETED